MEMTLEQLKAENETAPAATNAAETVEEETELDAAPDVEPEGEAEGTEAAETEAWMQTDEQASEEGKKFTGRDIAAAKRPLKAKLTEAKSEIEQLRAEIEQLRNAGVQQAPVQAPASLPKRPKLADFDYDEGLYAAALERYEDAKIEAKLATVHQTTAQRQQVDAARQALEEAINEHYSRAEKLVETAGINPDVYRQADLTVRQTIESIMPGMGDTVTDHIISVLGEGSEKVLYNLGRSDQKRAKLQSLLMQDKSGLKAATYLGELKATLTSPQKQTSNAPKPAAQARGDKAVDGTADAILKQYRSAHKAGDIQKSFDLRRQLRQMGVKLD